MTYTPSTNRYQAHTKCLYVPNCRASRPGHQVCLCLLNIPFENFNFTCVHCIFMVRSFSVFVFSFCLSLCLHAFIHVHFALWAYYLNKFRLSRLELYCAVIWLNWLNGSFKGFDTLIYLLSGFTVRLP